MTVPEDISTTEPLLAPLAAEEWGDDEYAAFGALLGLPGEKVPRAGSGHAADPLKFDIIGLLVRHPKMARRFLGFNGGMTPDDVDRLAAGNAAFDGSDRLVLDATDEILASGRAEPATWHRLVEELCTHQAMELIFVIGTYAMLATAFDTWRLLPPEGSAALPPPVS